MLSLLLVAVGGVVWAMRDNTSPTALWVWGWVVVGCMLVLLRFADQVAWAGNAYHLLSPLLPGFILAGSLVYAERRCPRWLLPAALGVGTLRWGLASSPFPFMANVIGAALEPAVYIWSAWLVFPIGRSPGAGMAQVMLAPALLVMGALEWVTNVGLLTGGRLPEILGMLWPTTAMLTLGIQVTAAGHRGRRQRLALQTESETARRALEDSEMRLSVLAEHSSDLIFEADEQSRITYVSPSVHKVLGYTAEQVRSAAPFAFTHPDDRDYGASETSLTLDSDEQRELLTRIQHGNGSWLWIETKMRSFETASGERRIVGIARDVTERREQQELLERSHETLEQRVADRTIELVDMVDKLEREVSTRKSIERQLRESRARYRAVSELSSDFAFGLRLAPGGVIDVEWMSDSFTRLTGYELEDLQAEGWRRLVSSDHWRAARKQMQQVFEGKAVEFEGFVTTKSGRQRFFHTRVTASRDGDQLAVVGASRDITARRRAEDERRELERRISEIQRLESLGVLAGGIAHDFNNLLSVILGNSALALADVGESSPVAQRIHRIRAAAQHAAGLTEQMLTYSGRTPPALKAVDLGAMVRDTTDLLRAALDSKITLTLDTNDSTAPMDGDITQLRQIVINLVTNAGEAIGDERGSVRVRTGTRQVAEGEVVAGFGNSKPPPGRYALLEVTDTGPGMDEQTQQRIFEPFYTTRHSGRGLGLAAVLGIVQGHGGYILVQSAPGRGTTFQVLFRYTQPPGVAESAAAQPPAEPARGVVLLVDDEPLVLEVGAEFLRRAGYEVKTATGGRDALALLDAADPPVDAVVLDLIMPEFDGQETLRAIQEGHPGLPVVLTSGYDEERTAERSGDGGHVAFLRKPYEPEELIVKVGEALAG